MKVNKDKLKKNHYWILAGVAPILALLAVILYATGVGAEVTKRTDEVNKKKDEVTKAKAKGKKVLSELDEQKVTVGNKREELWKDNWNRQAVAEKLFEWPVDPDPRQRVKRLEEKSQKFGTQLQNENDVFAALIRPQVFEEAYNRTADIIRPTAFPGRNWRSVFRYVSDWTQRTPKSEQIWLALEDLWIQRGLMYPIRDVNSVAAQYAGEPAGDDPLKRSFHNPVWKIDFEVATDPSSPRKVIKSKLTNRTDRLQFLGVGNEMRLLIWLSDRRNTQPIFYRIQGDLVKAGETKDIPVVPQLHSVPPGTEIEKIAKVEQILDIRSVPVKQVINVELGYKDARTFAAELLPPKFWPEGGLEPVAASPFGGPPTGSYSGPMGPMGGGAAAPVAKNGQPAQVLDARSKRYLDTTDQVRRMPVAVVLLIDQLYMQEVLTAYANSPLRFQIAQYHWKRYRSTGGAAALDFNDDTMSAPPPMAAMGGMTAPGRSGSYSGPMSSYSGPGASSYSGPMGSGFPGSAGGATVTEGQLTSGLIELTLYGIISLYEKFEEPKAEDAPPAETPAAPPADTEKPKADETPKPADADKPKADENAPKEAAPKPADVEKPKAEDAPPPKDAAPAPTPKP